MTVQEFKDYYTNLLIIQYKRLDRAPAHIEALVSLLAILDVISDVEGGFNIETAVGVQLDILGKYIGYQRDTLSTSDTDYRRYLTFKIIQNSINHSLSSIDELLYQYFPDEIYIDRDTGKMWIYYAFVDQDVAFVINLLNKGLIPKPAGVGLINIIQSSNPFVFYGDPDGTGFGKLSDDDTLLLDADGETVTDTDGTEIYVLLNEADPNAGGEFAGIIG